MGLTGRRPPLRRYSCTPPRPTLYHTKSHRRRSWQLRIHAGSHTPSAACYSRGNAAVRSSGPTRWTPEARSSVATAQQPRKPYRRERRGGTRLCLPSLVPPQQHSDDSGFMAPRLPAWVQLRGIRQRRRQSPPTAPPTVSPRPHSAAAPRERRWCHRRRQEDSKG